MVSSVVLPSDTAESGSELAPATRAVKTKPTTSAPTEYISHMLSDLSWNHRQTKKQMAAKKGSMHSHQEKFKTCSGVAFDSLGSKFVMHDSFRFDSDGTCLMSLLDAVTAVDISWRLTD